MNDTPLTNKVALIVWDRRRKHIPRMADYGPLPGIFAPPLFDPLAAIIAGTAWQYIRETADSGLRNVDE
jgi:hypothetical protein